MRGSVYPSPSLHGFFMDHTAAASSAAIRSRADGFSFKPHSDSSSFISISVSTRSFRCGIGLNHELASFSVMFVDLAASFTFRISLMISDGTVLTKTKRTYKRTKQLPSRTYSASNYKYKLEKISVLPPAPVFPYNGHNLSRLVWPHFLHFRH